MFPLGEMAAVCGFEAFINGKHIVGEVKEKETAHREYKKAVSEGHGAYLMDQDEETPVCLNSILIMTRVEDCSFQLINLGILLKFLRCS